MFDYVKGNYTLVITANLHRPSPPSMRTDAAPMHRTRARCKYLSGVALNSSHSASVRGVALVTGLINRAKSRASLGF